MDKLLTLNGPNLNLLGTREPAKYGLATLEELNSHLLEYAKKAEVDLQVFQSNSESELIDRIHAAAQENITFIIINPAAFTHTSVALRDALLGVKIPFIEVHLSNVHARDDFRKKSYFSDIAVGVITGLGPIGYELALQAALSYLGDKNSKS
ncbi:type II 3-dehydroquinate dehydratase [Thiogranum longum]|nr:type II 3-dehydroquinate dehydratase [Thiogranum longum]